MGGWFNVNGRWISKLRLKTTLMKIIIELFREPPRGGRQLYFTFQVLQISEELKKAVATSEEKIQQRSRRRGQFSSSHFSLPESAQTLAGIAFLRCRKIGESFSSSVEICRKTFPAGNFGQPQPSRGFLKSRSLAFKASTAPSPTLERV